MSKAKLRVFVLVVGAGFAGSTFARMAAEDGHEVLVIDKRNHIGGNAYDHVNAAGIRYPVYGPHLFHTNSRDVWQFLSRFTMWHEYQHRVKAVSCGQLVPIPINVETVQKLLDPNANKDNVKDILDRAAFVEFQPPKNAKEAVVGKVGEVLYSCLFQNYTAKMWGTEAMYLSPVVTGRIPVRFDNEDRYFTDKYQAVPLHGYHNLFVNMLDHPNIKIELNRPYDRDMRKSADLVCWTGPIDEYFDYCYGHLRYRSLRFEHINVPSKQVLPVATVNYCGQEPFTRITEYKQVTGQQSDWTTLTIEYPEAEGEPYYPIPMHPYQEVARRYRLLADEPAVSKDLVVLGRLGSYQYYNMDQVVAQAMHTYRVRAMSEKQVLA